MRGARHAAIVGFDARIIRLCWRFTLWAAVLILAAAPPLGDHVDAQDAVGCVRRPLIATLLTPQTAPMPREGGALVAGTRLGDAGATPGALTFSPISFTRRRTSQILTVVPLAPGLVRLVPSGRLGTGGWTVSGAGPDMTITVGRAALPGAPVRPSVRGMRRVATVSDGISRIQVRTIFDFPIPPGIVAILVYWNDDAEPATWTRAVLAQTEVAVHVEPGACDDVPEGTRPPPSAEAGALTARVAFVDQFGQVSPISIAVPVE